MEKPPVLQLGARGKAYLPRRILGRGAFGVAYLVVARDDRSACFVMKRIELGHMEEKAQAEAQNECAILSQLADGPFIVHVIEHFVELERLWIVMEYAESGDMAARIEQQKALGTPFSEDVVVDWIVQLLLALRYAHERKVLHRDLKPQNIFLTADGTLRLGDFGISRVLSSSMSVVSTCVGTPLYLSPEVLHGQPYDGRADVWSLGVLLFELCALELPFKAAVMPALVLKICRDEAARLPPPFSDALRRVSASLLAKEPQRRPHVHQVLEEDVFAARVAGLLAAHEERRRRRGGAPRPAARAEGGVSMTRAAELRAAVHARERSDEEVAARKEAAAEAAGRRDAMREQIRKDRLAAKASGAGGREGGGEGRWRAKARDGLLANAEPSAPPAGSSESTPLPAALFDLILSAAARGEAAYPLGEELGQTRSHAVEARQEEEVAAVCACFPEGKLLSERERLAARDSLEMRYGEVREAMEACTIGGQAGRTILNDAQRELLTIAQLLRAVSRKYVVVVRGLDEADFHSAAALSAPLREQVGIVSAMHLAEGEGDADGVAQVDGRGWDILKAARKVNEVVEAFSSAKLEKSRRSRSRSRSRSRGSCGCARNGSESEISCPGRRDSRGNSAVRSADKAMMPSSQPDCDQPPQPLLGIDDVAQRRR
ncbi:hypothetical protein AB1Y20_011817 [Prymnesium parvum]|uniref:non-specific serine/threonine protein kinase n=1 Tax=Prymnesium parvum TaxID=97485 RepID=A0AB34IL23_PRYPA